MFQKTNLEGKKCQIKSKNINQINTFTKKNHENSFFTLYFAITRKENHVHKDYSVG